MKRLIIADVHSNLPAFEAVLESAPRVDEIIFLGDVIGYGPHPRQCVDLLMNLNARAIIGNHDRNIMEKPPTNPSGNAAEITNWDHWEYFSLRKDQQTYLKNLPDMITISSGGKDVTCVHGSPSGKYLHPAMPDEIFREEFKDVPGSAIYFGHSHRVIDRNIDGRRLICFKAVGQPRDRDRRAGFAIEEGGIIEHRKVQYNVERVVDDVKKIGLPEPFLSRWIEFLRNGYDAEWSREYKPS